MQILYTFRKLALPAIVLVALTSVTTITAQQKTLYQRLGGYDALAAVTDEFIGRLATDKSLERLFMGVSDNSKRRIRQLVLDQLCEVTGGPCYYIGRDMKTSHKGLKITEKDWDTSVRHLTATLDKFKVPAREKKEVLTAIASLKSDIVEQ
ncbi:MAG TPA: group 1 truncated hemoglobin [Blastocatellia bacterium]|nr:group 1 truncated hemoglobin [Blastocatellia bacterium]